MLMQVNITNTPIYVYCDDNVTVPVFVSCTVNRYGYFRSDYKQAQDVVHRFIKIYDSLGLVLKCVSE